jgi:3-deoxy-D-manno-octulosonate 8-phosphate phosphatase (KDO 8-P phosphatase)
MTLKEKLKQIKMVLLDVDGTMTDGGIYVNMDGSQFKRFHAHDGEGIRRAQEAGIVVGIISAAGLAKDIIESRAKMLGIKWVHAQRSSKIEVAQSWANELGLNSKQIAFMGEDSIDLEVMNLCGVPAAPSNAHHSIENCIDFKTIKPGGFGAVREFLDLLLESQK